MDQLKKSHSKSRRNFIHSLGCLTIGVPMANLDWMLQRDFLADPKLPGSLERHPDLDAWIEVLADNRIRVFSGKIELGQGISTAIQQVAAEELNADLEQVEVVLADTNRTPNEGYTAGSGSVKGSAMAVRYAAVAARDRLCELAAEKLGVAQDQLYLAQGVATSKDDTAAISINDILEGKKWELEIKLPLRPKPRKLYRISGKSIPRADLEKIVRGTSFFIQDLSFAGMIHARVLRPPSYDAQLLKVDTRTFKKSVSKNIKLIKDGSFLAIIGQDEYQVALGIKKLKDAVTWSTERKLPALANLKDLLMAKSSEGQEVIKEGLIDAGQSGMIKVQGTFFKPYIMHGSIGPACGIARFAEGKMQVWTHSQGVFPFRSALASMLQLEESAIHVIGVPGAGCFGHNSADDAAADAAIIAKKMPGKHIRVQWSRNQEHSWEALGSAMRIDIEAGMTKEGNIGFWKTKVYSDSHSTRPNQEAGTLLPARYLENPTPLTSRGYLGGGYRNAEPYYIIANKLIDAHFFDGPLRVSSLRSLGAYANVFAIESIIDEMSIKHKIHPLDFRINLLDDARAIAVLMRLRKMTHGTVLGEGEGLGFAFSRYKNNDAYCAVAVHLSVSTQKKINLIKMWAAIDAGEVINQDGLASQTEGGMIQAASWTLLEEVKFDEQHITSQDWATYPILRYQDIPEVEVAIMPRAEDPPLGGGEAAQPPTPAAITNAIFRVTGIRVYELPVQGKI